MRAADGKFDLESRPIIACCMQYLEDIRQLRYTLWFAFWSLQTGSTQRKARGDATEQPGAMADQVDTGQRLGKQRAGLAQAAADWVLPAHRAPQLPQHVQQTQPLRQGQIPLLARLLPPARQQVQSELQRAQQQQQPGTAASRQHPATATLPAGGSLQQGADLGNAAFLLAMQRAKLCGWSAAQHAMRQAAAGGSVSVGPGAVHQRGSGTATAHADLWPQQLALTPLAPRPPAQQSALTPLAPHPPVQQPGRGASMPSLLPPTAPGLEAQPQQHQPRASQPAAAQPSGNQLPPAVATVLSSLQEASWRTAPDPEQAEQAVRVAWVRQQGTGCNAGDATRCLQRAAAMMLLYARLFS